MNNGAFEAILILLAGAVIVVALFRRANLPPILGYLFVGMLVGPYGLGWVPDTDDARFLAEFGVVFLLFTIGLEFSLPQLIAMKHMVFGLGGAQVLISTALAWLIAWLAGMSMAGAFVIGGVVAMSSTAIVIKQLTDQLELNSRHGKLAVGILLFQDLAVIPFLILIPAMAGDADGSVIESLLRALLKGAAVVTMMLAAGHWLLRPLFHEIARARSAELFMLTVLLFTLSAAWITHLSGLSLALGAFLAGMSLGETEFRHQVEADIRPFRDVLLGLFFVTIGMLLDMRGLLDILPWVLLITAGIIVVKALLITALARLVTGAEQGVALRTGLSLAQGGEFGFALLTLALGYGLLNPDASQVVLASVLMSMMLTPMLVRYNGHIAKRVFAISYGRSRALTTGNVAVAAKPLSGHVLICGYGRIGQNIARFLDQEGFDYIALDLDPQRVREATEAGERVKYGDSNRREILEAAGLMRARILVISYDDPDSTSRILRHTRELRPDMPILVRTRDDTHLERFQEEGATEVVPETLEASLMLASHLLLLLDIPMSRVLHRVREVRSDRYRMLRGFFHGEQALAPEDPNAFRERLHAVTLPEGAHAVGLTLAALNLEDAGVMVTAVRRGGIRGPQPNPDTLLRAGDVLVLYGTPEALEHAEAVLLKG
jgi:CPA2 family monovalent cation:H+ antiporter-2